MFLDGQKHGRSILWKLDRIRLHERQIIADTTASKEQ